MRLHLIQWVFTRDYLKGLASPPKS